MNDGGGCDMCSLMGGAVAFGITNTNLQKKREEKQAWGRDFCFTVNYFWDGTLMGQVLAVWIRESQTKDWTTKKRCQRETQWYNSHFIHSIRLTKHYAK